MNKKEVAEFHGVTDRAARNWSPEKQHRKTVQAEAGLSPDCWDLIGEIAQLVALYNAQNSKGGLTEWTATLSVRPACVTVSVYHVSDFEPTREFTAPPSDVVFLKIAVMQLREMTNQEIGK